MLQPEDYIEPRCQICMSDDQDQIQPIPVNRILHKLDEKLSRNDYAFAEQLIGYWIIEAQQGHDQRGELVMYNEMMGLQRKCRNEKNARKFAADALNLIKSMGITDTVTAATTYINAATVEKAFGTPEKALPLFLAAEEIYRRELPDADERLGGLFNNYALALVDTKRYTEARNYYNEAIEIMKKNPGKEPEQAITYLNIADLIADEKGLEDGADEIQKCLETAQKLLDTRGLPRDGNYAFVCEKCAPVFDYYGFFYFAEELRRRVKEIYERT